jgi:hypothetical protein
MPTITGSADRDRVGHALRPVGATTVQPDLPSRLRGLLAERQSDEDLIARFLLGYRDRTRAAYRADLRDFVPGASGSASGCWMCAAATSRPTPASWSKRVTVAPAWPDGWPP